MDASSVLCFCSPSVFGCDAATYFIQIYFENATKRVLVDEHWDVALPAQIRGIHGRTADMLGELSVGSFMSHRFLETN